MKRQPTCLAAFVTISLAGLSAEPVWAVPQDAAAQAGPPTAFLVTEAGAGDLNGDGDSADFVFHVYDAKQRVTINLGLAAASVCRATLGPPFSVCEPVLPVANRNVVALVVGESAQGAADLNSDGDVNDDVLYAYEVRNGSIIGTGLALARGVGRDVSSYTFPVSPVVTGDAIAFLVGEPEQGYTVLNGDADTQDDVPHVLDVKTGEIINLALAASTIVGPFGSRNPIPPDVQGQSFVFLVGESEQGSTDLNGDGDVDDQVRYVYNIHSGVLRRR